MEKVTVQLVRKKAAFVDDSVDTSIIVSELSLDLFSSAQPNLTQPADQPNQRTTICAIGGF